MFTLSLSSGKGPAFLSVVFTGEVTLDECREAFAAGLEAALARDTTQILLDFTQADIAPYPVIDGVKYAWHAAQLTFLDRVAYVVPGREDDLVVSLLRNTLDIEVRLFGDREHARAWLTNIAEPVTTQSDRAPLASCMR